MSEQRHYAITLVTLFRFGSAAGPVYAPLAGQLDSDGRPG